MAKFEVGLVKPARKAGGDRYEGQYQNEQVTFYIPQSISRKDEHPATNLIITIEFAE